MSEKIVSATLQYIREDVLYAEIGDDIFVPATEYNMLFELYTDMVEKWGKDQVELEKLRSEVSRLRRIKRRAKTRWEKDNLKEVIEGDNQEAQPVEEATQAD
jgi:hypothetical protein